MSYTIIVDSSEERIRCTGNIINMKKRHCRIGKVTPKPPKNWGMERQPLRPTGWHPLTGARSSWPWFAH